MDVHNRIADVTRLRCHLCQDFLKLIIADEWQHFIYERAEAAVLNDKGYKKSYIAVYEKMRDRGIESYSINDMDVSFINVIIQYCGQIAQTKAETRSAFRKIVEDRNITGHSNENEDAEELYLHALLALCNMRDFVRTMDKSEIGIDAEARLAFRKKYITEINNLKGLLDEERIVLVQSKKEIERDIQRIIDSNDPLKTFCDISDLYRKRYEQHPRENSDRTTYDEFIICTSDAGIIFAHSYAINYFLLIEKNYPEVERRLMMLYQAYETLPPYEAHSIVDTINYLFKLSGSVSDNLILIIDGMRDQGHNIELDNNGFYYLTKNPSTAVKKYPII